MITIEQCRGARGLLGWTQQDLADTSGLSKTAINNFEKGHSDIKTESLRAIRMAFESADIEFLENTGMRKKSEYARILKGKQSLSEILSDIKDTLSNTGGEIRISNVDKSLAAQVTTQKLFGHIEFLKAANIRERVLCSPGQESILSPSDECRWLPDIDMSLLKPTIIYGSKVAIQLWDDSMFVIISSAEAAKAEQSRFDTLWAKAQVPEGAAQNDILKRG